MAKKLGVNVDKEDVVAVAERKEADTKKAALVEVYSSSATAELDKMKLIQRQIIDKNNLKTDKEGVDVHMVMLSTEETKVEASTLLDAPSAAMGDFTSTLNQVEVEVEIEADLVALCDTAQKAFEAHCKQLQRWDDLNTVNHWIIYLGRLKLKNQWGLALKKIHDLSAAAADNKSKGDPVPREILFEVRMTWISLEIRIEWKERERRYYIIYHIISLICYGTLLYILRSLWSEIDIEIEIEIEIHSRDQRGDQNRSKQIRLD